MDGQCCFTRPAQAEHDKADIFKNSFCRADPEHLTTRVKADPAAFLPVIEGHSQEGFLILSKVVGTQDIGFSCFRMD